MGPTNGNGGGKKFFLKSMLTTIFSVSVVFVRSHGLLPNGPFGMAAFRIPIYTSEHPRSFSGGKVVIFIIGPDAFVLGTYIRPTNHADMDLGGRDRPEEG